MQMASFANVELLSLSTTLAKDVFCIGSGLGSDFIYTKNLQVGSFRWSWWSHRTGSQGVVYPGKLPRGTRAILRARIGFYLHKESPGGSFIWSWWSHRTASTGNVFMPYFPFFFRAKRGKHFLHMISLYLSARSAETFFLHPIFLHFSARSVENVF